MKGGVPAPRARLRIALFAAAALCAELALTRLCAFVFQYHYAFYAVALGIGGVGLGCAFAARARQRAALLRRPEGLPALAPLLAVALLAGFPALLLLVQSLGDAARLWLLASAAFLPFLFLGRALGAAFEDAAGGRSSYIADGLGATAGALVGWFACEAAGPLCALAVAVASLGFAASLGVVTVLARATTAVLTATAAGALLLLPLPPTLVPADAPLGHRLHGGGQHLASRWDAYARTDLVAMPALGFEELYTDGAAPAMLVRDAGSAQVQAAHQRELPFLPFALRRPARVLSLGGGAGYDAWLATLAGAEHIDVVELNEALLQLGRARRGTSADVLDSPSVTVFRDDSRRWLRHTGVAPYDLVVLALLQGEAEARASLALLEAGAYTVEALREYASHLSRHGRIAVLLHGRAYLQRLWRTAVAALGGSAFIAAFEHEASAPYRYLLYFGPEPATAAEETALRQAVADGRFMQLTLDTRAAPGSSPTTDERPFFFHTEAGAPTPLWALGLAAVVVALALVAAGRSGGSRSRLAGPRWTALASGVGFASLELLLVQRVLPPIGLPVLTLGVVSAGMLAGSALGAWLASRAHGARVVACAAAALALFSVLLAFAGPGLRALSPSTAAAMLWAAALSLVAGVLAGTPLPAALERAGAQPGERARLLAIASVGGLAASLAMALLSMLAGHQVSAALPAVAYGALAAGWALAPARPAQASS